MIAPPPQESASAGQLVRATALAALAAAALLVTVILPAEYSIDPTGVGQRLGLLRPTSSITAELVTAAAAATVTSEPSPFRSDEMSVTLAWGEGAEIKAEMARGQHIAFSWTSKGGAVSFDMHGERHRESDATSYAKGEDSNGANGTFQAPFDGLHGWYWENLNDEAVTITLRTSGFYTRLVRP
jgi:hypothetical protein